MTELREKAQALVTRWKGRISFADHDAGNIYRICIEELEAALSSPAPTLSDALDNLKGAIPDGPPDLASEHDHYIYGTPKRSSPAAPTEPTDREILDVLVELVYHPEVHVFGAAGWDRYAARIRSLFASQPAHLPEAGSDARDVRGPSREQPDAALGNDVDARDAGGCYSGESTASPARGASQPEGKP